MVAAATGVLCLELTPPGSTGRGGAVSLLWHPMQLIVVTSLGAFRVGVAVITGRDRAAVDNGGGNWEIRGVITPGDGTRSKTGCCMRIHSPRDAQHPWALAHGNRCI